MTAISNELQAAVSRLSNLKPCLCSKCLMDRAAPAMLAALEQIRGFVAVMNESNWRDLRLHIERQCGVIGKATGK